MTQWEYRVAPLKEAAKLKKDADELALIVSTNSGRRAGRPWA